LKKDKSEDKIEPNLKCEEYTYKFIFNFQHLASSMSWRINYIIDISNL